MLAVSLQPPPLMWTLKVVQAAEIVGRLEVEFGAAVGVGLGLGDDARALLPAGAGHAIADRGVPVEFVSLAGLQPRTRDHDWLPDFRKSRRRHQFALRRQRADRFQRLRGGR